MKEWDDEQIQRWLENQGTEPDHEADAPDDLKTYQLLFDALKKEPASGLPYNFSVIVEKTLIEQKQRSRQTPWLVLFGVGIGFSVFLAAFLFMMPLNQKVSQMLLTVTPYKWAFIFGLASVLLIQILDQKLVKERQLTKLT